MPNLQTKNIAAPMQTANEFPPCFVFSRRKNIRVDDIPAPLDKNNQKRLAILNPIAPVAVVRRNKDFAHVLWDADDFNCIRKEPTWAAQAPRRVVSKIQPRGKTPKMKVPAMKDRASECHSVCRSYRIRSPTMNVPEDDRNRCNTDPTHKRDVEVKMHAFGWRGLT